MTTRSKPTIVWFRDDLRLTDQPALHAAVTSGRPVLCIYIFDQVSEGVRPLGAASRWWLHHSLASLDDKLRTIGGRLFLFQGATEAVVAALLRTGIEGLMFNRRYQQAERRIDDAVVDLCRREGVAVEDFVGSVLHEPWEVIPKTGGFYKVFTPYWRAAVAHGPTLPPMGVPGPMAKSAPGPRVEGGPVALEELGLLPEISWDGGLCDTWEPGQDGAQRALDLFLREKVESYATDRDRLGVAGSSRLSPHLRFGEISPREVIAALERRAGSSAEKFAAELGWRDFNTALLFHVPDLSTAPFHKSYARFPFTKLTPAALAAWQHGRTGYPVVDAGMRQLWQIGTMHNRVRMITASFLVKHLLADWRIGERWFWDTLCDADPANNPLNWQWIAGCGNDPVPYFRIFNPVLQGEKFDPDGAYVRRYVPELADLPDRWIHKPWEAPSDVLVKVNVVLGKTYPAPMVDHAKARVRALDALRRHRETLDRDQA
ncbi:cryptochrome/photolyase family protein [Lichenifustis flavocetrariae]|uniref:Deoxyribodipyrimidine photo-lyase n=1 Tax=Lichenifustis flavocetrariae TaxID=2949735 RepID=A0AA41YZU1_9HYPH|nr:deoxyribodipyrimidine photo-lyase [Lichenifustis flavocetrariae]MCW6507928.1 DNA photolyase family protein [Lichenifustis flavocetrariae]